MVYMGYLKIIFIISIYSDGIYKYNFQGIFDLECPGIFNDDLLQF